MACMLYIGSDLGHKISPTIYKMIGGNKYSLLFQNNMRFDVMVSLYFDTYHYGDFIIRNKTTYKFSNHDGTNSNFTFSGFRNRIKCIVKPVICKYNKHYKKHIYSPYQPTKYDSQIYAQIDKRINYNVQPKSYDFLDDTFTNDMICSIDENIVKEINIDIIV